MCIALGAREDIRGTSITTGGALAASSRRRVSSFLVLRATIIPRIVVSSVAGCQLREGRADSGLRLGVVRLRACVPRVHHPPL
jgi:hypothetical protein